MTNWSFESALALGCPQRAPKGIDASAIKKYLSGAVDRFLGPGLTGAIEELE